MEPTEQVNDIVEETITDIQETMATPVEESVEIAHSKSE